MRSALPVYAAIAIAVLGIQYVGSSTQRGGPGWSRPGLEGWLAPWSQFDGPEYLRIVAEGYSYSGGERSPVVWFPGYPLAVRALSWTVGSPLVSAVLVSLASAAVGAVLYWVWLGERRVEGAGRRFAFIALLVSPFAWFLYGVVYSDALFLAVVLAAFVAAERDRMGWAALFGAVATATRNTGIAVVPALALISLVRTGALAVPSDATGWRRRFAVPTTCDRAALSRRSFVPLLALGGIVAWSTYLGVRFGAPLAWYTNQSDYHPETWAVFKRTFFVRWRDVGDNPTYAVAITVHAATWAIAIWSIPGVCRRFGFAMGVYIAMIVLFPTFGSGDFMGTGRYLLAAFPVAAFWGERFGDRPVLGRAVMSASVCLMALGAFGFSRSWYLS